MVIDKVRKAKYKKARKEGKTKADSMRSAGFAETTATHKQNNLKLVDVGEAEVLRELKAKDITVDYLIEQLTKALEFATETKKKDITNYIRALETMGRFVGVGKEEKTQIYNIFSTQDAKTIESRDALTQLIRDKSNK